MKKIEKPKGKAIPFESKEVMEKKIQDRIAKIEKAKKYGIDLMRFDDAELQLSEKDKKQYEQDVALFTLLLNQGKEIPKDLEDRLLKVKKLFGK